MAQLKEIPEVAGLDRCEGMVRIPPELDVPLTPRVRALVDTPQFQRLKRISQLGLVALVYPAAHHTRFEHSLGVYRLALLFLRHLAHEPRFVQAVEVHQAECFIAAALLHDLGHWPFCHPLEDIRLPDVPTHERFAEIFLRDAEIADVLRDQWQLDPADVLAVLNERATSPGARLLQSLLSGPIDIDKMDYLARDSLHAGVPYGRHFDQGRLIGSLTVNEAGDGLAITEKGKTAAELMVFARYVMFSEVYWHHGVRSATAMLQRAFSLLHADLNLEELFRLGELEFIDALRNAAGNGPASELLEGLFGRQRRLYKRLAQYSIFEQHDLYQRLARRPYAYLVRCAEGLAARASSDLGKVIAPHELLFDAPPMQREVEFRVEVYYRKEARYRMLEEVSPVVRTLAHEQFDDYVKRVRIFAHPRVATELSELEHLSRLVEETVDELDGLSDTTNA